MKDLRLARACALWIFWALILPCLAQAPAYRYYRVGNPANVAATPKPGFGLMGGGADLDEAFSAGRRLGALKLRLRPLQRVH